MNIKEFVEKYLGIEREEAEEFATFCPFHYNVNTPAFYINKKTGLWLCHNPSCNKRGRFKELVKAITGQDITDKVTTDQLNDQLLTLHKIDKPEVEDGFDQAMDRIVINYRDNDEVQDKLDYLLNRGFKAHVLEHFEVGYSKAQDRIVIPVRNENYKIVGFIGRALDEERKPKYKYTDGFPRRSVLLNLHNAKEFYSVIVVEGSLDHIKVHQAGFPNVVSTMGATLSEEQAEMLNKNFSEIVIFSDNDEAGEALKRGIMDKCPRKNIFMVTYPEGHKDPGDMTEEQIQITINNRISQLDYLFNNLQKEKNK